MTPPLPVDLSAVGDVAASIIGAIDDAAELDDDDRVWRLDQKLIALRIAYGKAKERDDARRARGIPRRGHVTIWHRGRSWRLTPEDVQAVIQTTLATRRRWASQAEGDDA